MGFFPNRGDDFGYLEIGDGPNVRENVVIHSFPEQTARLAKDSHFGHSAIVHGSKIGENVPVGMGAILHEGVEIGKDCICRETLKLIG